MASTSSIAKLVKWGVRVGQQLHIQLPGRLIQHLQQDRFPVNAKMPGLVIGMVKDYCPDFYLSVTLIQAVPSQCGFRDDAILFNIQWFLHFVSLRLEAPC